MRRLADRPIGFRLDRAGDSLVRDDAELLNSWHDARPRGLVFDLGSLKTPLRAGLEALVKAGCRVTSVHPMFGPDTELLSGRHVIFIDLGNKEALAGGPGIVRPDDG